MAVVRVDIEINAKGEATVTKTAGAMRELSTVTKAAKGVLDSLFVGIGQGVGQKIFMELSAGARTAATAVVSLGVATAKYGSMLVDAQAKTGILIESQQKLRHAGMLVGVTWDQVSSAASKMQKNLIGSPEIFNQLGLSAKTLRDMRPEDQLLAIGDRIGGIAEPAGRAAAAMAVFGKSGAELLPLLTSNMREAMEQAERLGLVMSENTARAADDLDDSLGTLNATWDGLARSMGGVIVTSEPLHILITGLTDIIGKLSGSVHDNDSAFRSLVDGGIVLTVEGLTLLMKASPLLIEAWSAIITTTARMGAEMLRLAEGVRFLGTVMQNPMLAGAAFQVMEQNIGNIDKAIKIIIDDEKRQTLGLLANVQMVIAEMDKLRGKVRASVGVVHVGTGKPSGLGGGGFASAADAKAAARDAAEFEKGVARANNDAMQQRLRDEQELFDFKNKTAKLAEKLGLEEEKRASRLGKILLEGLEEEEKARNKRAGLIAKDADAMRALGDSVGGLFGQGISSASVFIESLRQVKNGTVANISSTQKWAMALGTAMNIVQNGPAGKGKGALSGALSGAATGAMIGSVVPGIGTVVGGVIGGVAGGLLGFFSGGAKKKKQEQEAAAAAKRQAAADKEAARVSGVGLMESGLVAGIKGLGTGTAESAKSQATLLSAVFWTTFKEKGLLGAIDAFKGTFEQLTAGGFDLGGALGAVGNVMAAGVNEGFRAAAEGAQGFKDMLHGFIQADIPLTIEQFSALGQQASEAMNQARAGAEAAGLGAVDANKAALAAVSPLLQELLMGSIKYGIVLDANTLALLDQARAAGLAFPTDPMERMVSLLSQIVVLLGGAIPEAAGKAGASIGNIVAPGNIGGFLPGDHMPGSPFPMGAAKGFGPVIVPNMGKGMGPLIQTHAGEGVMIVPQTRVGGMSGLFHAKAGFSRDSGDFMGGGRGTGGGIFTGGGSISSSAGTITITPQGGKGPASQAAVEALTEQISVLKVAVEKAASAQPISVVTNAPISVEQNPLRIRESAVEAEEFAANAVLKQLRRRNADLVAELRAIQRGG